jgi:galactose mutarotase-like enzyme
LRDHGDIWGRPWEVDAQTATRLVTTHAGSEFTFSRTIDLQGSAIHCRYAVVNTGSEPLPYMWALHGLLVVTPDDRIVLPGLAAVQATYLSRRGDTLPAQTLAWPRGGALGLPLDRVHRVGEQVAAKMYAEAAGAPAASIGNERGWLDLSWDKAELPYVGLWFNYGGWPGPGSVHHLAIEPTTAPVDHLGEAIETGTARIISPGQAQTWSVSLSVRPGAQKL